MEEGKFHIPLERMNNMEEGKFHIHLERRNNMEWSGDAIWKNIASPLHIVPALQVYMEKYTISAPSWI